MGDFGIDPRVGELLPTRFNNIANSMTNTKNHSKSPVLRGIALLIESIIDIIIEITRNIAYSSARNMNTVDNI